MKKTILALITVLLLTGIGHTQTTPDTNSFFDALRENATIDTLYDFKTSSFMVGAGVPLLEYREGLVELRLELASDLESNNLAGAIVGFDPMKAISMTPASNWTWVASFKMNAGIGAMVDIAEPIRGADDFHVVGYLKLIELF